MKNEILIYLLSVQVTVRLRHWRTTSYAEHMALGSFYETMDDFIDKLIESLQGKDGIRIQIGEPASIPANNLERDEVIDLLLALKSMLAVEFANDGMEIQNLRDDFLGSLDKTLYLLSLS